MLSDFITKEIKTPLTSEKYFILNKIIKEQNSDSIIAAFNPNLIKQYIEISIKSENLFFYVCEYKKKIIGYSLLAKKPFFLTNEFKSVKNLILINLLFNFKLKALVNIMLAMSGIDLFFISKENKDIINRSLNLNLLAIDNAFQSQGFGKVFVNNILNDLKNNNNLSEVTVETFDKRAESFYQNKLNFNYAGKKLRFFKNLIVYKKKLL